MNNNPLTEQEVRREYYHKKKQENKCIVFWIDNPEYTELKEICEAQGVTLTAYVKRSIKLCMAKHLRWVIDE